MNLFKLYLLIYTLLAFIYLWYRYLTLFIRNKNLNLTYNNEKISVIIPYYNEEPDLLIKTIKSADNCLGDKEIIVIDDGSKTLDCFNKCKELRKEINFILIRYEENKGKRYAQVIGFEKAKGQIIITLDSDTILDKNALINLAKNFADKKIGAVTGQLEVLNANDNLLTKIQAARYWNAFNFERQSQGKLGVINCCSGPISAYRREVIEEIKKDYFDQTFLGKKATYGDDRHLTTLILRKGYKVKYERNALGYTDAPNTFKKFIKQQIRWKKSFLRETYLCSKFMFKKNKLLAFDISLTTFILFFSLLARIMLVISLILNPFYILIAIPMIALMAFLNSLYILFHKPKYFFYSILYAYVHAFLIYWLLFVALFTLKETKWGTR